ncbi:TetR/AcrR family transcriptional regulator [Perlucidibaca piscinae]|uniref:TetR/AcrR family transcriptional regulator n=1 Tax=Perlucidibaca piscinae TaxID=392589 RepID=UPI0003B72BD9|nr:TetR/AcrR family transcriptional regulator [Perlucidibaca piscinae]
MRKRPQQERSRQMVESLIDATEQCIARHGLDGTTTPRIAEIAGVSVGSLYQYFDDKEGLIEALITRQADLITRGLKSLPMDDSASLRDLIATSVRFGVALLDSSHGVYLELVRNWHRLPTQRVADALQQHFMETTHSYLLKHHRTLRVENLQAKVFIIVNSTLFTLVRLISQDNPLLTKALIADELIEMITRYMEPLPD